MNNICTNKEQSERLLALGLKPETADMQYNRDGELNILTEHNFNVFKPAWSLPRLLKMLPGNIEDKRPGFPPYHPELIKYDDGYVISIRRHTADCLVGTHIENDPIECCVSMIDWLIQNGYFNKEYLKG